MHRARYKSQMVKYLTDDVLAAACAAQRYNNEYLKEDQVEVDPEGNINVKKVANKKLIYRFLNNELPVLEEDREIAKKVRTHYCGLTFKILQGKVLSEFDQVTLQIAENDEVAGPYLIAVAASMPSCYNRAIQRAETEMRINQANNGYLGAVGSKVECKIEVMKSAYSQNFNVYFITGITADNKVVFFANRNNVEIGTMLGIKGTVKRHTEDNKTQLNRVKVV